MDLIKSYSNAEMQENGLDKYALIKFVLAPIGGLVVLVISSIVIFAFDKKKSKALKIILIVLNSLSVIAVCVLIAVYYDLKIKADGYYNSQTASVNQPLLYIFACVLAGGIICLSLLFNSDNKSFDTKCLAFSGITVAMSFGLSYIRLWKMPQGGSITFASLLPIMIFSFVYGSNGSGKSFFCKIPNVFFM